MSRKTIESFLRHAPVTLHWHFALENSATIKHKAIHNVEVGADLWRLLPRVEQVLVLQLELLSVRGRLTILDNGPNRVVLQVSQDQRTRLFLQKFFA